MGILNKVHGKQSFNENNDIDCFYLDYGFRVEPFVIVKCQSSTQHLCLSCKSVITPQDFSCFCEYDRQPSGLIVFICRPCCPGATVRGSHQHSWRDP